MDHSESRKYRQEMEESFRLIDFLLIQLDPCIKGYDARMNLLEVSANIEKLKTVVGLMIEDKDLVKNANYRIKVIDPCLKDYYNRCGKALWTGFYFKGLDHNTFFWLSQVEVLSLVTTDKESNDKMSNK